uniref:F-box domain-containing protein n=1 Tax=Hyaloperonospora arabidopsidis (strain Emoy2) TaxID=559515 RepID=M4BI98_HYAAE
MEHLPDSLLADVFALLAARDVLHVTSTCRALSVSAPSVQLALQRAITRRFAAVTSFFSSSTNHWPRSLVVLRGAELLRIKELLARCVTSSFEDAASCASSSVVVSRAWLGAYKKRCQAFEHFLQQFRRTKRQQRRQKNVLKAKEKTVGLEMPKSSAYAALVEAGAMIVCAHDALLPATQCVGRSRRAIVSGDAFQEIAVYAPELRGFPLESCRDCSVCVLEHETRELEVEVKKRVRFDEEIAGSGEMLELLQRKNGYPKGLFSPVDLAGSRHQQLAPHLSVTGRSKYATYFLVPKKWLNKWRKFVRSQGEGNPGPVLNAELVCLSHQRTIVPPYISLFLSGFSLEQSLKATQM